jgi:hypothetical protein
MIFTATERIGAPRDFVFARASEFDRLARAVRGRGAVVRPSEGPGGRPRFEMEYPFRDSMWPVALDLRGAAPAEALEVGVEAAAVSAVAVFGFRAPLPDVTLVEMTVTLSPKGMQGRLLLGSLHMVRSRVQERLDGDLAALARGAERLWREAGGR